MKRLRATFLAGAALVAASAPALAQNVTYQVDGYALGAVVPGTMQMCMNSAGRAVPCPLSDLQPGITKPFRGPDNQQRAAVVALSPNAPTNLVNGSGSATGTGATTIIKAPGAGRIYVTGAQCFRTDAGTTAAFVTLNDAASTIVGLANSGGGGGNNMVFRSPLIIALATALTFTASGGITTIYCNAQGFVAP